MVEVDATDPTICVGKMPLFTYLPRFDLWSWEGFLVITSTRTWRDTLDLFRESFAASSVHLSSSI